MSNPMWRGIDIDPALLENFGWFNDRLTVNGAEYVRFIAYLVAAVGEMDDRLISADVIASATGGALPSIRYAWDTGTADANPGTGKIRGNNGSLAGITTLYLSTANADGVDVSAMIGLFDDSTSSVKGVLGLAHRTDPTKWAVFTVSGSVVTATGYRKVTVAYVAGPGSFSAADPVSVGFVRTGDKGDTGAAGTPASESTAGVAEIATQTEVDAGTDDSRFVTALKAATRYLAKVGGRLTGVLLPPTTVTLTDGATITPNFSQGHDFTVTLGGNRTLANPTNISANQGGSIVIKQDATGSRTLAFGAYFKFPNGTAPTLTTTAGATDRLDYWCESATVIHANLAKKVI